MRIADDERSGFLIIHTHDDAMPLDGDSARERETQARARSFLSFTHTRGIVIVMVSVCFLPYSPRE